jgi:ABC-type lipoprotein release transport system permease subunit
VHQQRRDLALLKALGFTGRQAITTIVSESTISVACGLAIGAPFVMLGPLAVGHLRPQSPRRHRVNHPEGGDRVDIVGGLLFANLFAALPARAAARSSIARVLRTD